jgi:hypothetical protein
MLLSVPDYFRHNPDAETDVKNSALFLVSIQTESGNVPCAMDEAPPFAPRRDEDDLVSLLQNFFFLVTDAEAYSQHFILFVT